MANLEFWPNNLQQQQNQIYMYMYISIKLWVYISSNGRNCVRLELNHAHAASTRRHFNYLNSFWHASKVKKLTAWRIVQENWICTWRRWFDWFPYCSQWWWYRWRWWWWERCCWCCSLSQLELRFCWHSPQLQLSCLINCECWAVLRA